MITGRLVNGQLARLCESHEVWSHMRKQQLGFVKRVNYTTWEVPSATTQGFKYQVNVKLGTCACSSGHMGASARPGCINTSRYQS